MDGVVGTATGAAREAALETLRKFFMRARRVEAHSLMKPPDAKALMNLANGEMTFALSTEGIVPTTEYPDEERMESLADRVRPVTLGSESVHHAKVIQSIRTLAADGMVAEDLQKLDDLAEKIASVDLAGSDMYAFSVQSADGLGKITPPISDSSLAGGWFYLDVAHTDAKGHKKAAEEFDLNVRYEAAVPAFARLALVVLELLHFLRSLIQRGLLDLGDDVETARVVYDTTDRKVARVFLGPPGRASGHVGRVVRGMEELTPLHLMAGSPGNIAQLLLIDPDGAELTDYHGIISDRGGDDTPAVIDVEDCVRLTLSEGTSLAESFDTDHFPRTNARLAKLARIRADLFGAERMLVILGGKGPFFEIEVPPDQDRRQVSLARADFLDDIVAIDMAMLDPLPVVDLMAVRPLDVRLASLVRALLEGEVVTWRDEQLRFQSNSPNVPDRVVVPASTAPLANLHVHVPETVVFHPDAQFHPVTDGADLREGWVGELPEGESWYCFAPTCRDEDPAELPDVRKLVSIRTEPETDLTTRPTDTAP